MSERPISGQHDGAITDPSIGFAPAAIRYLGIRICVGVLALATYWAFSRIVSPEIYGQYALIVAAASGLGATLYSWLGITLIRHLPDRSTSEAVNVSSAVAIFAVASAVLLLGFIALAAVSTRSSLPYLAWGLVLTMLAGWFGLSTQLSQARLDTRAYSVKSLIRFAGLFVLGLAFLWAGGGALALILANALALAVAIAYGMRTDAAEVAVAEIDRAAIQKLVSHGLPVAMALAMAWVVDLSDRFLVYWFLGQAEAGRYALAYDVATQPARLLISAAGLAILPHASRAYEAAGAAGARPVMAQNLSIILLVGLPVAALEVLFPGDLARLLVGQEYRGTAAAVMPAVGLAMVIQGLRGYYLDISLHLLKRTRFMIGMWIMMAGANLVLNLALIPIFGSVGAAYATLAAHLSSLIYYYVLLRTPEVLSIEIADMGKIALATTVFVGCFWLNPDPSSAWWFVSVFLLAAALYGGAVLWLNVADIRSLLPAVLTLRANAAHR